MQHIKEPKKSKLWWAVPTMVLGGFAAGLASGFVGATAYAPTAGTPPSTTGSIAVAPSGSVAPTNRVPAEAVEFIGRTGLSVFDVLQLNADLQMRGETVIGINGRVAGAGEFWVFSINGKVPAEGAGATQTKDGDAIRWSVERVKA